jgi:hypothetical protein
MIRTGTFQYVRYERIADFHARGWMIVSDLKGHHGQWSVLMWRCECGEAS